LREIEPFKQRGQNLIHLLSVFGKFRSKGFACGIKKRAQQIQNEKSEQKNKNNGDDSGDFYFSEEIKGRVKNKRKEDRKEKRKQDRLGKTQNHSYYENDDDDQRYGRDSILFHSTPLEIISIIVKNKKGFQFL
jgi:hypothetical protein